MALFGRSKKKKKEFNPTETVIPDFSYSDDLQQNILYAIGSGSHDTNRVKMVYESGDVVYYFFKGDVLKNVESEKNPVSLSRRAYWDNIDAPDLLSAFGKMSKAEFYKKFASSTPERKQFIDESFLTNAINVILKFYGQKVVDLKQEIIFGEQALEQAQYDYLNIPTTQISQYFSEIIREEEQLTEVLTKDSLAETKLRVLNEAYNPKNGLERMLMFSAENKNSLQMLKKSVGYFTWYEVLAALNNLVILRALELDYPNKSADNEDSLADINLDLLLKSTPSPTTAITADSLSSGEEESSDTHISAPNEEEEESKEPVASDTSAFVVNDDWHSMLPPESEDDDGGFDYDEVPDVVDNSRTQYLLTDFDDKVKLLLANNDAQKETIKLTTGLLTQNRVLEEQTKAIENLLVDSQNHYEELSQELKDSMWSSNENIDEKFLNRMRDEANVMFDETFALETQRKDYGIERDVLLNKLERIILALSGDSVQEVIYELKQKQDSIHEVRYLTIQTLKGDLNSHPDLNEPLAEEIKEEIIEKIEEEAADDVSTITNKDSAFSLEEIEPEPVVEETSKAEELMPELEKKVEEVVAIEEEARTDIRHESAAFSSPLFNKLSQKYNMSKSRE